MEETFKVHISIRRDSTVVVSGEESNVLRCAETLADMSEEVETTIKLPPEQLYALMGHEGKYRKMIEQESRVRISLDGTEGIRVSGGVKAVKNAERGVSDLFRSESCVRVMRGREQSICCESIPAWCVVE